MRFHFHRYVRGKFLVLKEAHQLSIINYQLSIINYQLSIINYQLPTPPLRHSALPHVRLRTLGYRAD